MNMQLRCIRGFLFLLDRSAPARRSREFLLYFLKIIVSPVVFLVHIFDCEISSSRRVIGRNAGRASGGALGRSSRGGGPIFRSVAENRLNFFTFQGLMQPHGARGCSNDCISFTVNVTEGSELLLPKD